LDYGKCLMAASFLLAAQHKYRDSQKEPANSLTAPYGYLFRPHW